MLDVWLQKWTLNSVEVKRHTANNISYKWLNKRFWDRELTLPWLTNEGLACNWTCIIYGLDMNYFKSEDRLTDMYGDAGKQLIVNGINVREGSGQPVYTRWYLEAPKLYWIATEAFLMENSDLKAVFVDVSHCIAKWWAIDLLLFGIYICKTTECKVTRKFPYHLK